jgi:hypothetical protein
MLLGQLINLVHVTFDMGFEGKEGDRDKHKEDDKLFSLLFVCRDDVWAHI